MGGKNLYNNGSSIIPRMPMKIKGACQLISLARYKLNGTPKTEDMEKAMNTEAMACPLFSYGNVSAIMDNTCAPINPPNKPVKMRAVISKPGDGAMPQVMVPMINPA